jgi:hypothetical protein
VNRYINFLLWFLAAAILLAPLSFVVTIMLFPLFRWFEAFSGIESVGHSGPAEWCFYLVYGSLLLGALLALKGMTREPGIRS